MRRLGKVCGERLLGAVVTAMTPWAMGALSYSPLPPLRCTLLALTFGLATAAAFLSLPQRRRTLLGFGLMWGLLVLWWRTSPASNTREWQPDVAVLPSATLHGDHVTLHHIRSFAYRTATDFTPRYDDKTFAERKQRSHINARAQTADEAPDCSQLLRARLPTPPPAGGGATQPGATGARGRGGALDTQAPEEYNMTTGPKRRVALFVERSHQQWVVRDPEGNFWRLPSVDDPWRHRQPFTPTPETELEPVPGH